MQDGFKHTAEVHYNAIIQQANQLQQQVRLFISPGTNFTTIFSEYLGELASEDELAVIFSAIKDRLNALDPINLDTAQLAFLNERERIQQDDQIEPTQKEKLNAALFGNKYSYLQAYFEAYQYDVKYYLSKMEQVCTAAEEINQLYPQLKKIIGTKNLDIEQQQLSLLTRDLINLAVAMLKEKAPDLEIKPETVGEAFYDLAKQLTIAPDTPWREDDADIVSPSAVHLNIRGKSPLFFDQHTNWVYIADNGKSPTCG